MTALSRLTKEEAYLFAILQDDSGIDQAEFTWTDETSPDAVFRCWDFQYCLTGDTVLLTSAGRRTLREAVGPVRLLTGGAGDRGAWVDAEVRHFGRQEVMRITLARRGVEKTIRATPEHRWFAGTGRADRRVYREVTTETLSAGDYLQPMSAPRCDFDLDEEWVRAGVVYGDGTVYGGRSRVYLWGNKMELSTWFKDAPITETKRDDVAVPGLYVGSQPEWYKTSIPSLQEPAAARWGWLAGYFATDGCVEPDGTCVITSRDPDALRKLRDLATSLGVVCGQVGAQESRGSFGGDGEFQHRVVLRTSDLPADFFLRSGHRSRRRIGTRVRSLDAWRVVSIARTGEVENVFCAVVPNTHSFVLDGDILTGNCWYRTKAKFQIDQCGRAIGKSVGIQMRAFAFPFTNAGEEMLITAPELIHLDPVTKNIEDRINSVRLGREFLKKDGTSKGFKHRPFEATFRNGASILGRIPQEDGKGVKGMHPKKLEMDEAQDYPEPGWVELGETLKYGREDATWRAHGVSRGVRDRYYKQTQPESGWRVHRYTAMHRPDWTAEERAAKAELYGSRDHPDYRRNILGLHGDASSALFVLTRLMACVDQNPESDYNAAEYYHVRINDEKLRESGLPIEALLDFPERHKKYTRFWVGMDVGMTNHPSEILVFAEDYPQSRAGGRKDVLPDMRLKCLARIHLVRISSPEQHCDRKGPEEPADVLPGVPQGDGRRGVPQPAGGAARDHHQLLPQVPGGTALTS